VRSFILVALRPLILGGVSVALAASAAAAGVSPNDRLLILDHRAGPYEYLAGFSSKPNHRSAYEIALAALGEPTRFKTSGNLCRVTWASAGLTVGFASELQPCAPGHLYEAAWYGMTLFGPLWHTRTGIKVGSTVAAVRLAYPRAAFARGTAGWLDLIVVHDQEFTFTKLAVTVDRAGRVRTIEVPAAYIY
jgi:hypothetical protein